MLKRWKDFFIPSFFLLRLLQLMLKWINSNIFAQNQSDKYRRVFRISPSRADLCCYFLSKRENSKKEFRNARTLFRVIQENWLVGDHFRRGRAYLRQTGCQCHFRSGISLSMSYEKSVLWRCVSAKYLWKSDGYSRSAEMLRWRYHFHRNFCRCRRYNVYRDGA